MEAITSGYQQNRSHSSDLSLHRTAVRLTWGHIQDSTNTTPASYIILSGVNVVSLRPPLARFNLGNLIGRILLNCDDVNLFSFSGSAESCPC